MWFEVADHYVLVHTLEQVNIIRDSMKDHESELLLADGKTVKVGRRRHRQLKERLQI